MRRFVEVVHVGVIGVQPAAFRWRGSRYVVRDVLGHWRERRSWWMGAAARAIHHGTAAGPAVIGVTNSSSPPSSGAEYLEGPTAVATGWAAPLAEEYEVWRVEAARGSSGIVGVYDLCHDTGVRPDTGAWRLLRIAD